MELRHVYKRLDIQPVSSRAKRLNATLLPVVINSRAASMSYVFRSSGYIRDRSVYCRCIVSFACRYTVNVHVNVNVVSLYLSCYTSYIVRDFAKRSTGISTRRFARTLTFVRKFYQFDNIVQGGSLEKDDTREGGFIWRVKN